MTPKEKAEELYKKMYTVHSNIYPSSAIQCALISVDEIMYNNLMDYPQHSTIFSPHKNDYWQEVKQEIEKL